MARAVRQAVSAKKPRPLAKVARRALDDRLDELWKCLRKAVKTATPRNVHRVRVAGRRLLAARKFFRDLLPDKPAKWLKKEVRQAHKAAGQMRNLDVYTQPRRASMPIRTQAALSAERWKAYRVLGRTYKRLKKKGFGKRAKSLLNDVRWRGDDEAPPFAEEGMRRLKGVAGEFAALATKTRATPEPLHTLRVAGKRLRYTVELCEKVLPRARYAELLRRLERFQDAMGAISDAASAVEFTKRISTVEPQPKPRRSNTQSAVRREQKALDVAMRKYQKQFPRAWFAKLVELLS